MWHQLLRSSRRLGVLAVTVAVVAATAPAVSGAAPPDAAAGALAQPVGVAVAPSEPGAVVSMTPARIADSRVAQQITGAVPALGTATVQVTGQGGVPDSGVAAAVLNVTVVAPQAAGYLTVWPAGIDWPDTSNLNFQAGQDIANAVIVRVGTDGKIQLFNGSAGAVHVVVDVTGYTLAGTPAAAGAVVSMTPARIADSRVAQQITGAVPALGTATVQVTGQGGVPDSGVAAAVLNVTVVAPQAAGYLTVWPAGIDWPDTSNLNFQAGQDIANAVIVRVGADGKIQLFNGSAGAVHVVVDVTGYTLAGTPAAAGAVVSMTPARIADSRVAQQITGAVPALGTATVQVTGQGGVPDSGVAAAVLNVTVVAPQAAGYLTVWPAGIDWPDTSNLNFQAGQDIPNAVIVPVGTDGKIQLFNGSAGAVHVVVDVTGYTLAGAPIPAPTVSGLAPTGGSTTGGTVVTVTGTDLTGATAVTFGGAAGTDLSVVSGTELTVTSPAHDAGNVDVQVTTPAGSSPTGDADTFAYTAPAAAPTVSGLAPTGGSPTGGTVVTVTGTDLTGATAVTFGGTAGTDLSVVSGTELTVTSPAHDAGNVDVQVTTPAGSSPTGDADTFAYTAPAAAPTVSGLAPTGGSTASCTTVTVTGTDLTGATAVTFGGTAGTDLSVVSGTELTVTSPAHDAGNVDVQVTTPAGSSPNGDADTFAYTAPTAASPAWAWGSGSYGQLGNGCTDNNPVPVPMSKLTGVVTAVAAGGFAGYALLGDGTVQAWGYGADGELGNGGTADSSTPVPVSGLTGVTAIAAGASAGYALLGDGTVQAWGYGADGELGNGLTANSSTPVPVSALTGVTAIAAGASAGYALLGDGTVQAWGYGADGELGNGLTANSSTPVPVSALTGVTAIAAGASAGYALLGDGTVQAWGYGADGELGNGLTANSSTPVPVSALTGVTAIAAGASAGYALLGDGTVQAWGYGADGELGNGLTADSSTPVPVSALTGVTAIAAGASAGYALLGDGTVQAWGYGADGELGDGGTANSSTPVPVSALTGVTAIAAGGSTSYALTH